MGIDYPKYTPYILLLIFILLALLIPGGPIEVRDFSHLSPAVVWGFDGFLTLLGFGSLALVYFLRLRRRWAYGLAIAVGFTYFVLALLDLFHIFPKSPTPMTPLLLAFEVAIAALSLLLMFFAYQSRRIVGAVGGGKATLHRGKLIAAGVLLVLLALAAVTYASLSILR